MDSPKLYFLCIALAFLIFNICVPCQAAEDASLQLMSDAHALKWPMAMSSLYEDELEDDEDGDLDGVSSRRSLFWHRMRYYISYGALSANRIPCPPRSGRSYYTHNCYRATGPVRPYTRGCSAITRCRR